jgi:hypothetical protein
VLRYLRGTQSRGITYGNKGLVYCDADHAGALTRATSDWGGDCAARRRSGLVIHAAGTVAASTCEAEYQAAGVVAHGAVARKILTDLGLDAQGRPAAAEQLQPIVVDCDNQGAIALLNNPASTRRSKHIDIIHHFARDRVEQGQVEFKYCPSAMNVSDCFRSRWDPTGFNSCLAGMGVGISFSSVGFCGPQTNGGVLCMTVQHALGCSNCLLGESDTVTVILTVAYRSWTFWL